MQSSQAMAHQAGTRFDRIILSPCNATGIFMTQHDWPAAGQRQRLQLAAGAGKVEAVLSAPRQGAARRAVLLLCHPHPLYGGTMDNKVVTSMAAAAHDAGWHALRFNFRGVGGSAGIHDEGIGEAADCVALAQWLRREAGASTVALGGFSFGGYVALRCVGDIAPAALVTIAPAWRYFDDGVPPQWPECPWTLVHARDDDVIAVNDSLEALKRAPRSPLQHFPEQAGHFFHGALDAVRGPARSLLESVAD